MAIFININSHIPFIDLIIIFISSASKCIIQSLLKMKNAQINILSLSSTLNKYIPSPQSATVILNYFVYNSFQDFNTWQQISKSKVQYDYIENQRSIFGCKVTLKWDQRTLPTIIQTAQGKTKKSAKKRALKKLIQTIINQGLIAHGFRQDNFVEKLPKRIKNDSDESEEQIEQQKYPYKLQIISLLNNQQYKKVFAILSLANEKWKQREVFYCWRHGLSIKSVDFLRRVIKACRGQQVSFQQIIQTNKFYISQEQRLLPRQFSYGKLVNNPLTEELTDFIRYQQLQKVITATHKPICQPNLQIRMIPSENVLKEMKTVTPSRQQLTSYFHPIEGRKIFLSSLQNKPALFLNKEINIELPKFELFSELTLKICESLYGMLPFYCLDYSFVEEVIVMMKQQIGSIEMSFQLPLSHSYQQQGIAYYLKSKNLLTSQFCYLLHDKILLSAHSISIEGIVTPHKQEDHVFIFNCKEPEEIINRKVNKRFNYSEFEESHEICLNQFVALISKIDRKIVYIGQIIQFIPLIKIYVPQMNEQNTDPQPYTLYKIYNSKIFQKTSSSIIKASKQCMKLLENTTIIWQPPSFPILSVLSELLIEWQIKKSTVLIVSLNADILHSELTNLGFKIIRITQKTEQRLLTKYNIVIALPTVVCCDLIKNYAFSRVIIESSHLISEISTLSAIVKGCEQLYLMGDPFMPRMQVYSPYCIKNGMGISLLERLYKEGNKTQTYFSRLQNCCQYRNVMEWADIYIYNKKLMLLGNELQTPIIKGFPWPSIDYRLCFLNHPRTLTNEVDYLEQQAFICSVICAQVIKSGYTKIQQITCSVASLKSLPFLQKRMSVLLKMLNYNEIKLFTKHMNNLCRLVTGSIYSRRQLSILMLGSDSSNASFRQLLGAMQEGRRGIIVIGDMDHFYLNQDYANFIDWCKSKKLINRIDVKNMSQLS